MEGLVDVEKGIGIEHANTVSLIERELPGASASLVCRFATRVVNEDALHGDGRGLEEPAPIAERGITELQVGLMNERGGIERMPSPFARELGGGETAEFVVDLFPDFKAPFRDLGCRLVY